MKTTLEKTPVVKRYRIDEFPKFFVDVEHAHDKFGNKTHVFHLGHDDYGIKILMFSVFVDSMIKDNMGDDDLIKGSIASEVNWYIEEYFDKD